VSARRDAPTGRDELKDVCANTLNSEAIKAQIKPLSCTTQAHPMSRILISYRRADSAAIAGRIGDRLVACYGADTVFMDIDTIPFGTDFRAAVKDFLKDADAVVAIIGPSWRGLRDDGTARIVDANDPVRAEIETALTFGVPVIPALVLDANMPDAAVLPEPIRSLAFINAATVDVGRDFGVHMDRLITTLDEILAKKGQLPSSGRELTGQTPPPALIIAATVTVCVALILPFAAAWANYAAPAPRGSAVVAVVAEAAAIAFAFLTLRRARMATRRRIAIAASTAFVVVACAYLLFVQSYTFETPTTRQLFAMGYKCTPDAELLYKAKCLAANIGRDELIGAEYEAERLWTRRTIDNVKIALFLNWVASFTLLGIAIGSLLAQQHSQPPRRRAVRNGGRSS
jgi:hypothetical protein